MSGAVHPEWKETGLPWLGSVPWHWIVAPIRYLARPVTDRALGSSNQVGLENIESWTGNFVDSDSEFEGQGIAFRYGDILFGKLRPYLAKVALAPCSGEAVGDFIVIRPKTNVLPDFLHRFLLTPGVIQKVNSSTTGAKMPRTNWDALASIAIAIPPREEQIAIVQYINRETARIDALIGKKERFIQLLKEKRAAVITHAVTKGLDPSVPMRDSGVEWLGKVPAHWGLVPFWSLFSRTKSTGHAGEVLLSVYREIGVVPREGREDNHNKPSEDISLYQKVEEGFLVINKMKAWQGSVAISPYSGVVSPAYFVYEPKHGQNSVYLHFLLRSECYTSGYLQISKGIRVGQWDLDPQAHRIMTVCLPPLAEQAKIANHIEAQLVRIDKLVAGTDRSIELLREKRAALITAAVTGKIDVRAAA